jgi:hypothetical protein
MQMNLTIRLESWKQKELVEHLEVDKVLLEAG